MLELEPWTSNMLTESAMFVVHYLFWESTSQDDIDDPSFAKSKQLSLCTVNLALKYHMIPSRNERLLVQP